MTPDQKDLMKKVTDEGRAPGSIDEALRPPGPARRTNTSGVVSSSTGPVSTKADPANALEARKRSKTTHWYELDWLLPFRDLVTVIGFALFVAGIYQMPYPRISHPLAMIVTGAGILKFGFLMSR